MIRRRSWQPEVVVSGTVASSARWRSRCGGSAGPPQSPCCGTTWGARRAWPGLLGLSSLPAPGLQAGGASDRCTNSSQPFTPSYPTLMKVIIPTRNSFSHDLWSLSVFLTGLRSRTGSPWQGAPAHEETAPHTGQFPSISASCRLHPLLMLPLSITEACWQDFPTKQRAGLRG